MLGAYLLGVVVGLALSLMAVAALQWAFERWVHWSAAVVVGIAAAVWLSRNIISGILFCAQPPQYVPPAAGQGGEGRMVFNCDSAGGVIDRVYLYNLGPLALICLILLTARIWQRNVGAKA